MSTDVIEQFTAQWLAKAADEPDRAFREWDEHGVTLLRCGRSFAAIRLPHDLVHAALAPEEPTAEAIAFHLGGPLLHDGQHFYFALIQWHAGLVWDDQEDTPCLAVDTYLGVPRLDRRTPPGSHWVVAPRYDGDLCRPETLRRFIASGRQKLTRADAAQ